MTLRKILTDKINRVAEAIKRNPYSDDIDIMGSAIAEYKSVLSEFENEKIAQCVFPKYTIDQTVYWLAVPDDFQGANDFVVSEGKIKTIFISKFIDEIMIVYNIEGNEYSTKEYNEDNHIFATEGAAQKEKTKLVNEEEARHEMFRLMFPE